ncbi:hypothetical protein HY415_01950 [Candidatus Kaiserbacteria bacterium]|nr:hypothetical protein [Candidatus Kaiserbacteria bacterium]
MLFFRLGLASFFLANSLIAWFSPSEFIELLGNSPLASAIAAPEFWIPVIGVNDALLFLLILSGRWQKVIAVWSGLWMVAVIYVAGFGTIEFIEHLGLLFLIAYYYFTFRKPYS